MRRSVVLLAVLAGACSGSSTAPTTTTTTTTPTKIIRLTGDLNFGGVGINQTPADRTFTVNNDGTANLTVTSVAGPCGGTQVTLVGSTSFAVAPKGSVPVTLRYRPTSASSCSGHRSEVGA